MGAEDITLFAYIYTFPGRWGRIGLGANTALALGLFSSRIILKFASCSEGKEARPVRITPAVALGGGHEGIGDGGGGGRVRGRRLCEQVTWKEAKEKTDLFRGCSCRFRHNVRGGRRRGVGNGGVAPWKKRWSGGLRRVAQVFGIMQELLEGEVMADCMNNDANGRVRG